MNKEKIALAWSGGKDCSYALHLLRQDSRYEVVCLFTTCQQTGLRVNMHGLPIALVQAQANAVGLPLYQMPVPDTGNQYYEAALQQICTRLQAEGVRTLAFGDIFLEDLRAYRDALLQRLHMQAIYPLWQRDTSVLLQEMIEAGFRSTICCTDTRQLPADLWLGVDIDEQFSEKLPAHVDPCGERGEYHSFCHTGPIFNSAIAFRRCGYYQPLATAPGFEHFAWLDIELVTTL